MARLRCRIKGDGVMAEASYMALEFVSGDTETFRVLPVDIMRAERHIGKPIKFDDMSFETGMYIAYSAAKRAGKAGNDFDAWSEEVVGIEGDEVNDPKA